MKMRISEARNKISTWRLNEELIQDKEVEGKIRNELEQYVLLNETQGVSEVTIWETHKAYIRVILISMGARKKKER